MMISYNISRQYLSQALLITPGKRAATVSPLEGDEGIQRGRMDLICLVPNALTVLICSGCSLCASQAEGFIADHGSTRKYWSH
jgi:hypothetical protein